MKTIWKYPIPISDQFTIKMPFGAELLALETQSDQPCLWAVVDTEEKEIDEIQFYLFGTGREIRPAPPNIIYVGTFMMYDGKLVWHLFREGWSITI